MVLDYDDSIILTEGIEKSSAKSADGLYVIVLINVIISNRNKVYGHNDLQYHWFKDVYIEKWGMTDEIYDDILAIANICIDYCNEILKRFSQRLIYEYSNHDDVKHLFGLKTEWDEEKEILEQIL